MDKYFSKIENKESQEKVTSKIELHLFRHSIKTRENIYDHTDDDLIPLSPEGRKLAQEQGEASMDQSVAFGSPRIRSQETSLYKMGGKIEGVTADNEFDELLEKIDEGIVVGSKLGIDKRLDFNFPESSESEYSEKIYKEYEKGNYFKFLINESDVFAESVGDNESLTYQRGVKQIGSILEKYLKVSDRWNEILEKDNEEKYKLDTLKRFMGSHQGVTECFLAKVVEDRLGKEKLSEFIEILDNKGFDFTEGYKVDINKLSNGEKKINISYMKNLENNEKYEINESFSEQEIKELIS